MSRVKRERFCCDGLCAQGRKCPAFAPGVIDGPYVRSRAASWRAIWRLAMRGQAALLRWLYESCR